MTVQETLNTDIIQRTKWYVFVRFFFLISITVPAIASILFIKGWTVELQRDIVLALIALASNYMFYLLVRIHTKMRLYYTSLAAILLTIDIFLITFMIFINGGIESRSPILYTMPILMAAAIFGRRPTYLTALACALLYSGLIVADYLGVIHSVSAVSPELRTDLPYVINTVVFFAAILFVIAMATDFITRLLLTKQRQANKNLRALLRAQEIAKLGSWERDLINDKIVWSDELVKIFGLSGPPKDLSHNVFMEMVHRDDLNTFNKTMKEAIKHKKPFKVNYRIVTPDGTVKHIHAEGRPLLDSHERVIGLTGTAQDVSETYHLDNAKKEFVSLASHQLRTPASGVKAFLSLLLDGYAGELTDKQREFAKQAFESNERQMEIIENLLNLAAIESGKIKVKKEPVKINDIIRRCLPNHEQRAREQQQKLLTKLGRRSLIVNADPSHLQMAIDNLISNALKYTLPSGTISVSTRYDDRYAYVDVDDTGIGISPKDRGLLFQKFSRIMDPASKTVGGSGLGLYLADYMVKRQGGRLYVESTPGQGSRFTIRLPLHTTTARPVQKPVVEPA